MKATNLSAAQRAYDNELPEPEGSFVCVFCGVRLLESNRSKSLRNTCIECEEGCE